MSGGADGRAHFPDVGSKAGHRDWFAAGVVPAGGAGFRVPVDRSGRRRRGEAARCTRVPSESDSRRSGFFKLSMQRYPAW